MKKNALKLFGVFAILMAVVVVISCKKEKSDNQDTPSTTVVEPESQNLLVTDVHNSDCLNSGAEKSDTIGWGVTLDRIGNDLYFEWSHCMSGCGLDSFAVRSNIIGDTLEIDVRAYGQWASCTCNYDLDATINNVPSKRYFVKLYYWIVTFQDIRGELWYSKWINL
ncbi:MAG: hypothetical protein IJQ89_04890 [Bacteroidales bacterium]|nr:hypothetical protein [Bacteroidales bacterium]